VVKTASLHGVKPFIQSAYDGYAWSFWRGRSHFP